ncbi:hypothetical protein [Mycolicibacterium goodii]|uniref:Resuscitation-promoting factor RpfA n=1 Tax=Mycolicibacterium goodii TaxID=134601 RepID=A0ABS6HX77_MYCGD|nr:hypothetical protein [Mycolicibacterium goodii]MBU8817083.1 hypothetical protein [Mycolicibacterium goodii]MBU8827284.1 hypothetical protein [Mycolicibacterium goodii]MBU8835371.1 hypothetical protein [Mycolicibacterium goodii]PJK18596.1 hypothetical protein CSX11_30695 [Mycolicibacterium goodii]
MNPRIARTVSGVLAAIGLAAVAAGVSPVASAEPVAGPTVEPTPAPGATSTVDELTDMVLDALENAKQDQ